MQWEFIVCRITPCSLVTGYRNFRETNRLHFYFHHPYGDDRLLQNFIYRGADKSLAQTGRKQVTATEDFDVHISYL